MRLDEYYANVSVGKELCHHGVKGQAWGVTNGPPYPLNGEGKAQFKENKKILKSKDAQTMREKTAARHGRAAKANQAIIKSKTETSKEKAKQVQAKNEIKKARHAWKDAQRRDKIAAKRESEKLKAELRERKMREHAEKQKLKAEEAKAKAEKLAAKTRAQQEKAKLREASNVKSPKELLKQKVIMSGDKKLVAQYRHLLNDNELRTAQARINLVKELKGSKLESLKNFARNVQDFTSTAKNSADNTISVLNSIGNVAKVANKGKDPNSTLGKLSKLSTIGKPEKSYAEKLKEEMNKVDYLRVMQSKTPLFTSYANNPTARDRLNDLMAQIDYDRVKQGLDPIYFKPQGGGQGKKKGKNK